MATNNLSGYRDILLNMLAKHGVDPSVLYVYMKTGLLITEDNVKDMTQEQMIKARKAAFEYRYLEIHAANTIH